MDSALSFNEASPTTSALLLQYMLTCAILMMVCTQR